MNVSNLHSLHHGGDAKAGVSRDASGRSPPSPGIVGAGLHGGGGHLLAGVSLDLLQGDVQGAVLGLGQGPGQTAEDSSVNCQGDEGEDHQGYGDHVDDGLGAV